MDDAIEFATQADIAALEGHGVSLAEATRQWSSLNSPAARLVLDRPCTVGDGIEQLPAKQHDALIETHQAAADAGRWQMVVPASGAASRMFSLKSDEERQQFGEAIQQFAFYETLTNKCGNVSQQPSRDLIDVVVSDTGLGYSDVPKGLVEFHKYDDSTRTPFEEHLANSMVCFRDKNQTVRIHFTVSAEHQARFEKRLQHFAAKVTDANFDVTFSVQHPSTDTIAIDSDGKLLRNREGSPVLRPGGHGALIANLNDLDGDLLFLRNIDNVCHGRMRETGLRWMQLLGGFLVQLQSEVHQHLRALKAGDEDAVAAAKKFVLAKFSGTVLAETKSSDSTRDALLKCLDRPLRVCGMVKNEGEPGGGPFWVKEADQGAKPQIVETAEVDLENPEQKEIVSRATHFNPVFLALAVRDEQGRPYDLKEFVEEDRAIITSKTVDGETATVLERPGLWNGSMARWNTLFVEVPGDVFTPVKTVLDLLRPEHQPS